MKSKQHKSICHLVINCGKCNFRIVGSKKNHVCPGQRKCKNCKKIVGPNHQCYIQPKLVDYSDTESSDDEDDIRPPPRKRRAMTMYSDDEDGKDLTSYYTIKAVNEKKSRLFRAQGKEFQLNIKTFPDNVSPYQFISRLFDQLVEDIKERCQMESNDKM